jgi:anion-transporting  ArsA/GET3 family ATPase
MKKPCNLYLFTGKGGVGKTTLALSFAYFLKEKGYDVTYTSIASSNIGQNVIPVTQHELCDKIGIKYLDLVINQCAEGYVAKKLNSKMVAGWVVKTPFFKALVNMIPGFSYLIFLGRMLEEIVKSDNKKIIIFDSPASGHALTLLESTQNFNEIFRSGVIFDDTNKMLDLIHSKDFMQINVVSILTEMSMTEGTELLESINKLKFENAMLIANNALAVIPEISQEKNLPSFLKTKLEQENILFTEHQNIIKTKVPHIPSTDSITVIKTLAPYMENLV